MKKFFILILMTVVIFTTTLVSCKSAPPTITDFSAALGKDWKLIEVKVNDKNIDFDRKNLEQEGFGDIFTIKIDTTMISGKGAPNTYSAPYNSDASFNVKMEIVRSTLMAPLVLPEKLREHEFFGYIQNTYKWGLVDGKLQLNSRNLNEDEVVLTFSL